MSIEEKIRSLRLQIAELMILRILYASFEECKNLAVCEKAIKDFWKLIRIAQQQEVKNKLK